MPRVDVVIDCPAPKSFRAEAIAGRYAMNLADKLSARFAVEVPELTEDWAVGLIVGPSGSGKSTVARELFGAAVVKPARWAKGVPLVDAMPQAKSVDEISDALSAVGLGTVPAWLKPYEVLSNGERFRAELARALLGDAALIVFDEFTSVVDRTVAAAASCAIAKAIRRSKPPRRFVAVTCHYDVAEWLEADWVLDMATQQLARGSLRRPTINVEIRRCSMDAWRLFAPHHYLTGACAPTARAYLGLWEGRPVAFAAALPQLGKSWVTSITRLVVLPDYQGLGIGGRVLSAVASIEAEEGRQVTSTSSHPGLVKFYQRSPEWRVVSAGRNARNGFVNERTGQVPDALRRYKLAVTAHYAALTPEAAARARQRQSLAKSRGLVGRYSTRASQRRRPAKGASSAAPSPTDGAPA